MWEGDHRSRFPWHLSSFSAECFHMPETPGRLVAMGVTAEASLEDPRGDEAVLRPGYTGGSHLNPGLF